MLNNHRFKIRDLIHVYRSPSVDAASLWVAKQSDILHGFPFVAFRVVQKWLDFIPKPNSIITKFMVARVTTSKVNDLYGINSALTNDWPDFIFVQLIWELPQAGFLQKSHQPDAEILPKVAFPAKTTDVT